MGASTCFPVRTRTLNLRALPRKLRSVLEFHVIVLSVAKEIMIDCKLVGTKSIVITINIA